MALSSYNVVVIHKDARTLRFQADDFRAACLELKRILPDPFYQLTESDPVFLGLVRGSSEAYQYTVGELIREVS